MLLATTHRPLPTLPMFATQATSLVCATGAYPLPPDLITEKSGPVWDRIKAAWDACRAFNPSGSLNVSHT